MFPVFFDKDIFGSAPEWKSQGRPKITPIYSRNYVQPVFGEFDGDLFFIPYHQDFILVEGIESPLGGSEKGWENDYSLCVNPAQWDEKNLQLMVDVDPDLADKVYVLSDPRGDVRRKRAIKHFADSLNQWGEGKIVGSAQGFMGGDTLKVLEDGRAYLDHFSFIFTQRHPAKARVIGGDMEVTYTFISGDQLVEKTEKLSLRRGEHIPDLSGCEGHYQVFKAVTVPELMAQAQQILNSPLELPQLPKANPIEKGYPEAVLPQEVEIRGGGHNDSYWTRREMAVALGYEVKPGSDYRSRTGSTMSVVMIRSLEISNDPDKALEQLKGINGYIAGVDLKTSVLWVKPENLGRVIGREGTKIKIIQRVTRRHWEVKPLRS